ncbi:MAG: MerR family transcriptional regulator [Bacillota bacterium]
MEKSLYSVKEVQNLCHVTRKQLRYYEEKGLISALRNCDNNYRYYTESEICKIAFISECRDFGFSLASIQNMMVNNDAQTLKSSIKLAMRDARNELAESMLKYEMNMERYSTMMEAAYFISDKPYDCDNIEIVDIPAKNIVYYDYKGNFVDKQFEYYKQFSKLDDIIKQHKFSKLSPRMYQFSNHFNASTGEFYNCPSDIRLFYEVKENMSHCKNFMHTKPVCALSAISVGDYNTGLISTYQKIIKYAEKKGIKLDPISIEEALLDTSISYDNDSLWVTRINIIINSR